MLFFVSWQKNIIGDFSRFFEGVLTFVNPKIALRHANDNLGVKKVLAPSKNSSKSPNTVWRAHKSRDPLEKPIEVADYRLLIVRRLFFMRSRSVTEFYTILQYLHLILLRALSSIYLSSSVNLLFIPNNTLWTMTLRNSFLSVFISTAEVCKLFLTIFYTRRIGFNSIHFKTQTTLLTTWNISSQSQFLKCKVIFCGLTHILWKKNTEKRRSFAVLSLVNRHWLIKLRKPLYP